MGRWRCEPSHYSGVRVFRRHVPRQRVYCYNFSNNTRHTSGLPAGTVLQRRVFCARSLVLKYAKQALAGPDLLARWEAKGLLVADPAAATRALTFVGYFRLRGYGLPFMRNAPGGGREFLPGTRFEQILELYEFDRELRGLVMNALERVEVAVRTVISHTLSLAHGPFWYFNQPMAVLGPVTGKHGKVIPFDLKDFLRQVDIETKRSTDEFAVHYYSRYTDPPLPPSWLVAECISFGKWSLVYRHLKTGKTQIATVFNLPVDAFESWIHGLSILRNTCAHHGRVWNRRYTFRPKVLRKEQAHFANPQSFYCYAAVIRILTRAINVNDSFAQDLRGLLARYPNVPEASMGFLPNWQRQPLWN